MVTILDLPNEILNRVALSLGPEDVVNFALINRHFFNISQIALRRHAELCKLYATVNNRELSTLPALALEILLNPYVAHYHNLRLLESTLLDSCLLPEIKFCAKPYEPDEEAGSEDGSVLSAADLYTWLKAGDQFFILALLLLLLPNLARLSWQIDCSESEDIEIFIPFIRRLSLQKSPAVCSNVQEVALRPLEEDGIIDYDLLKAFMSMPSVSSAIAQGVLFEKEDKRYMRFDWPDTSNISRLTINEPQIVDVEGTLSPVKDMLHRCKSLKVFKYKFSPHTEFFYSENDICSILTETTPLLEELTLSFAEVNDLPNGIFRLRELKTLSFLETEAWILPFRGEFDFDEEGSDPSTKLSPALQHLRLFEQPNGNRKE